ncbi:MAG: TetR/AcrR family transcriptional regulator C-terminal domain-containing protein [Lachnospiraceae bacterium]|nr:TetR/AcrR family transcriptional regulator C-terminal domain-containing protein [Lachnospiraceae bacterium]
MALRINTKEVLAASFQELAREMPLESILIKDITDNCGASRTTFYKHFKDKYDLMNWIFKRDVDVLLDRLPDSKNQYDEMAVIAEYIYRNKEFYSNVNHYKDQNSLRDFIVGYASEYMLDKLRKRNLEEKITDDLVFSIRQYVASIAYMLSLWIDGRYQEDPKTFSKKVCDNIPEKLAVYFS